MGNSIARNRFWWYRSLYDDYLLREFRMSFMAGAFIWLPSYWWGVHFNRELEVMQSHKIYLHTYGPMRNRLTHSMLFEQFEMHLEEWEKLEEEFKNNGEKMLEELEPVE